MGHIGAELITQFGISGVIMVLLAYVIYEIISYKKKNTISRDDLKMSIKNFENDVNNNFIKVDKRIDNIEEKVDENYEILSRRINEGPKEFIKTLENEKKKEMIYHKEEINNQIPLTPKISNILKIYLERIGCDHIFLGSLHNGSKSINGIPYLKYDIISERIRNGLINVNFKSFSSIYKDVNIMIHDNLPVVLSQQNSCHYIISDSSELSVIDDILYRRCLANGVKQLSINLITDKDNYPIGFIGCIDYDIKKIDLNELSNCAKDIAELCINI